MFVQSTARRQLTPHSFVSTSSTVPVGVRHEGHQEVAAARRSRATLELAAEVLEALDHRVHVIDRHGEVVEALPARRHGPAGRVLQLELPASMVDEVDVASPRRTYSRETSRPRPSS